MISTQTNGVATSATPTHTEPTSKPDMILIVPEARWASMPADIHRCGGKYSGGRYYVFVPAERVAAVMATVGR